jgi:hypothetical protein
MTSRLPTPTPLSAAVLKMNVSGPVAASTAPNVPVLIFPTRAIAGQDVSSQSAGDHICGGIARQRVVEGGAGHVADVEPS